MAAAKATASEKFAAGQYTEALEHYRSAQALLEAEANAVKIHTQLLVALINNQAACLLKLGDDRACCDLCDKVLQLEPGNVKALLRRAMANEHRERYVQARADFKAAAQRAPGLQAAVDGAARMSKMLRSLEGSDLLRKKAAKAEAKAEEVQPLVVEKPTSSADVTKPAAMATSKTDSATAGPFSSASSKPATPAAKTPTTAKDHYEKLKAAGNAHVQAGRFAEAAKAYGQCIALDASNPAAFNNRSLCWLKLGAYGKAEADATLVLYHEPTNVKALYRRALARKEQDDMLGAIEDLERLLQLEPQNTAAASELATLYDKSKKGGAPKESRKTASAAAVATEEAKPAVKTEPAASKPAPSKVPAAAAGGKDKATPLIQELSSTSSPTTAKPTATLQASSAKVASPVASLTSAKTTPAKPAAAPPAATATPKPSLPPKTTPTTTPAASAPSLVSQPPLRAVDFWRAFNQYRRQPPQLAEVLLSVPAAKLASYLDNQLEAEDAEAIVASLAHAATQQATEDVKRVTAAAYSRLRALAQTSRLDIAVALMDDDQRRATAAAASTICDAAQRVGVDIDAAGLDEVRRAFTD